MGARSLLSGDARPMLLLNLLPEAKFWRRFRFVGSCLSGFPGSRRSLEVQPFSSFSKGIHSDQAARKQPPDPGSRLSTREPKYRPQREVCQLVLDHFDSQYRAELGEQWDSARSILLNPHCWQYGVLLNCFSDLTGVQTHLTSLGYYSILPQPRLSGSHGPLECFVHKDAVRLPTQRHHPGWLKQYYLLNASSLLPALALGVKDGEKVLDLCSAPGGKALALMQTARPRLLHCNEVDESRCEWLVKTLESYIPASVREMVTVTNMDGRSFGSLQPDMYDKVLVDAPCSNDRSWLFTPAAQQGELWLRERAQLPLLQKELLCSALSAVRPGGLVVYSTCTLSQAENQSVVEEVLTSCSGAELLDLEEELIDSLSKHFTFACLKPSLGHLVVPEEGRTWGPMFVCRLRRVY